MPSHHQRASFPYTPEQAFARDLLIAAVNGGINRWARVHGYSVDVPADQVRAEGIDIGDRYVWTVTLAELQAAMNKLAAHPDLCASHDSAAAASRERVQAAATTIRVAHAKLAAGLNPASGLSFYGDLMSRISETADVAVQVAVAGEVIY